MRLGKPLEHLQAALKATQISTSAGEQITTIGRQLAYAGYLTYDSLIWVSLCISSLINEQEIYWYCA